MSKLPFHTVQDARGDERPESVTDQTTAGEDRRADAKLRPLVPFRQQEQGSREERSLHKAEEETREECPHEAISCQHQFYQTLVTPGTHLVVIPVKVEIMPQTTMHTGRYIDGLPM